MDKKIERLKAILKKGYTERPTFGTDPRDPWSTRYNINESASLDKYLKSRGINPQFVSKDTKVAHSKSLAFLAWQKAHQNEEVQVEGMMTKHTPTEKRAHQLKRAVHYGTEVRTNGGLHGKELHSEEVEDTITFDIPLLIRMLEYAREDAKTDMDLHKVVKKLIGIRDKGTLTMDDYTFVTKIKEEFEITEQDCKCKDKKEWEKVAQSRSEIWRRKRLKIDEDLRQWFSKSHPEGGWKRINSKGEAIGPCAREPGEPKPKCMSNEKRAQLSKKERAAAVAAKRKHDPVADRSGKGGKPVNVSNYGKGKLGEAATPAQQAAIAIAMKKAGKKPKNEEVVDEACWDTHKQVGMKKKGNRMVPDCVPKNEEVELIDEKNSPTNPKLWSRAKAMARSKFDVYPSAYANGWASKWYKSKGGGWKTVKEDKYQDPYAATQTVGSEVDTDSMPKRSKELSKSARIIKSIYKKKGVKEDLYDHEKESKSVAGPGKKPKMSTSIKAAFGDSEPQAAAVLSGGKTLTGGNRDTIEIDPLMRKPKPAKQ